MSAGPTARVLHYVSPGTVMMALVADPTSPAHASGIDNLDALRNSRDAHGREFETEILDPGPDAAVSYANHYLANGAVIVPVSGDECDDTALAVLRELHPGRKVIGVPGEAIAFGGGGPHCITQQIPFGVTWPS